MDVHKWFSLHLQMSIIKSVPLALHDLSQTTEAQRTPYSRAALPQRGAFSKHQSPSEEAATDSSLFCESMGGLWKANPQPVSQTNRGLRRPPEVCADDGIDSRRDTRVFSHRVKVARASCGASARLSAASGGRPGSLLTGW